VVVVVVAKARPPAMPELVVVGVVVDDEQK
jgi:hypothetical protein